MDLSILDWLYLIQNPEPTAKLQLYLKQPSINWECKVHVKFKSFQYYAKVFLNGPYATYSDLNKVCCVIPLIGLVKIKACGETS